MIAILIHFLTGFIVFTDSVILVCYHVLFEKTAPPILPKINSSQ
jgi:hypothetical protein